MVANSFFTRSGSSANLEMALQLIKSGTAPANQILFAFWGAAKWGLGGSTHYVTALSKEAREQIALYLNFDRIVGLIFCIHVTG